MSPELKNVAKLPATAVTTKMAHASRTTSITLPRRQRVCHTRRNGQQLHGAEKGSITESVDIPAFLPGLKYPYEHGADDEDHDGQSEREHQAREQTTVPLPYREEPRQFFSYHSGVSFRPRSCARGVRWVPGGRSEARSRSNWPAKRHHVKPPVPLPCLPVPNHALTRDHVGRDRGPLGRAPQRRGRRPGGYRRLTRRYPAPRSVVDRLVGGRPEVEQDRQPGRRGRPLDHEDCRHVLGRVVVPAGAVYSWPSVAADRGQRRVRDWPGSDACAGCGPTSRNPSRYRQSTPAGTRKPPSAQASGGRSSSASPTAARAPARRGGYRLPAGPRRRRGNRPRSRRACTWPRRSPGASRTAADRPDPVPRQDQGLLLRRGRPSSVEPLRRTAMRPRRKGRRLGLQGPDRRARVGRHVSPGTRPRSSSSRRRPAARRASATPTPTRRPRR